MIAIVPARGGSKGLKDKNIKPLCGRPLIEYTIEAALESDSISEVIISTDCQKIFDTAVKRGATGHFLRPSELARDESLAIDNYIYTIDRLEKEYGYKIDAFTVLQPTSPLRTAKDIDNAVTLFKNKKADSVISYCEEHHPISWHKYIDTDGKLESIFLDETLNNRQDYRPSFFPNGAVYVFKAGLIRSGKYHNNKTFPYIMPRERSVDIDTQDDFDYANFLLSKRA
ncbi:cytidylyltransferase domain-containing protein [Vibrio hepatarius]|uniref:acylneuraminate cytidylyltransferase family protein n=1 Tax=Vibrio hepatarius TaxID=171383 RepID=UPI001C093FBC|nr:acylneuraminate cytidylyltransferase family protein [Vibrio hepatarius]MBU2896866.1 acylneuraminate cytidylyltransferase family protein [Vibrio hepatarius]